MKTKLSVIVPTVNAAEELDLALRSLQQNSDHDIELIVVVDPDQKTGRVNQNILKVCQQNGVKAWVNETNLGPYGNWNKGAGLATSKWLIFATDDQYFAPHWDTNLLKSWAPKRLVAGQLVEPGIIPVYKTNIQTDFGTTPKEFKEKEFIAWCTARPHAGYRQDGFFIPLLIARDDFDSLGHYPEGGQFGTSAAVSHDYLFIQHALKRGYEFGTATDSYSYHFQGSSWKKKSLKPKIAAVVLTQNSEKYLAPCLKSLDWVNQIIVVDGGSTDQTLSLAKKYHSTIHPHTFKTFAQQRNYAISKTLDYDWVFMVDADEEVEASLAQELQSFAKDIYLDGVNVPRKNYIFGRWVEHTDWYPDLRLIFFRPKMVTYVADVHERAEFKGGHGSTATAQHNLIHHNYDTVEEFVTKNLLRYPREYAQVLDARGVTFSAPQMITTSLGEFMRRFFLTEGYKDGMTGLLLSLLMGIQNLVSYIYLWEIQGKKSELTTEETQAVFAQLKGKGSELAYWLASMAIDQSKGATKLLHRARRKAIKLFKAL